MGKREKGKERERGAILIYKEVLRKVSLQQDFYKSDPKLLVV